MRSILAPLVAATALCAFGPAAEANVQIDIDLSNQTMHVRSASGADYDWPVSTGRPGYRTPTGVYHPQRMYTMIHSSEYEDAPMPHAIFFNGGYAIHATGAVGSLGQVASHGCVRLSPAHAAALFEMVKREGATIVIGGHAPGREQVAAREPRRVEPEAVVREPYRAEAEPVVGVTQLRFDEAADPAPARHARSPHFSANAPLENF